MFAFVETTVYLVVKQILGCLLMTLEDFFQLNSKVKFHMCAKIAAHYELVPSDQVCTWLDIGSEMFSATSIRLTQPA